MNKTLICVLPLALALWSHWTLALESVVAALEPPVAGSFRQPRETLYISVPVDLSAETLAQLTLELDAIDVSQLAQQRDGLLSYTPAQPLAAGDHELRLMYYGADGSVRELGYWLFEVRQSPRFRRASVEGYTDLAFSQRIAESDDFLGPEFGVRGGGQVRSHFETAQWRFHGEADLMYANHSEYSLTGRKLDVPGFLLQAETGRYQISAGDHRIGQSSLLLDGYQQRGISTAVSFNPLDTRVALFGIRSSQSPGVDGGVGVNSPDNRITGTRWSIRPMQTDGADIYLSSTYVSGRVSQPDYGSFDSYETDSVHDGEAWNLTLDSQFFERRLRVRLEGANSRYDFDGRDFGFDPVRDSAWSALAVYDPAPTGHSLPIDWHAGVEWQYVGTFYQSLANLMLPADKYMRRAFAGLVRDKWYWDGSYALQDNNLDQNPDYATTGTTQWMMRGGYSDYEQPEQGLLVWLGRPNYSLTLSRTSLQDDITPEGYLPTDLTLQSLDATAAFSRDQWQWSLGYLHETLDDATGYQPDTRTRGVNITSSLYLSEHYSLTLGWQGQRTLYRDQRARAARHLYSLAASAIFIPDRLYGNVSLGINQNNASDDPFYAIRDESRFASASISWQIKPPDRNSVGLGLSLSLAHNDYRDRLYTFNQNGYQALIELRTVLPSAYPGDT